MSALQAAIDELKLSVVHNGSTALPLRSREKEGIEEVCFAFLQEIRATGFWKIDATGNKRALRYKQQEYRSLVLRPPVGQGNFASAIVCTRKGQLREVVFNGNLSADVLVSRTNERFGAKRLFIMEDSKPIFSVLPPPEGIVDTSQDGADSESFKDIDNVILFLSVILSEGGHALAAKLEQDAQGIGGEKLIRHCLEEGFIDKNGTAAYSITEKGRALIPTDPVEVAVPVSQPQPQPIDVAALIKEVAAAREILEERDKIGNEVGNLKKRHRECDGEVKRIDAEILGLEQKIKKLRQDAEAKRSEATSLNQEIQAKTTELNNPRFNRAQQTLDHVAEVKRQLAEL